MERPFDFGSRSTASKEVLTAGGLQKPRPDWVVIPLSASAPALVAPAQQGISAGMPVAVPVAGSMAAPAAAPAAPAVRDEHYYAAQEQRLKSLKRLREQDLISEQEYQQKRGEILKSW